MIKLLATAFLYSFYWAFLKNSKIEIANFEFENQRKHFHQSPNFAEDRRNRETFVQSLSKWNVIVKQ